MTLGSYVGLGVGLGIAAGVSPGPLLTLVVSASLARGLPAGARIAVAPLLTDVPIVLVCLTVLDRLPARTLAVISILGAVYVLILGIMTLVSARTASLGAEVTPVSEGRAGDVWRGVLANLLNPHPWIAWISVMGPVVVRGFDQAPINAIVFVGLFYVLLVGSKLAIAALVARGRHLMSERVHRRVLAATGLVLIVLSGLLARDAFHLWSAPVGLYTHPTSSRVVVGEGIS